MNNLLDDLKIMRTTTGPIIQEREKSDMSLWGKLNPQRVVELLEEENYSGNVGN